MSRNTISDVVEGRILQLLHHGCSQCQIFKVLKSDGIDIARSTISNVKRKISQQRNAGTKIKLNRNRPLQTLSVVNQVIVKIDVENPSTQRAIAKAVKRAHRLYRQLTNGRYKNFIITDESWFYLDGTNDKRKQDSFRSKEFMVWGGISSKSKTTLRFVEPSATINSNYYINKILEPFLSWDIPRLFPKIRKCHPLFHQDSAPSHVSKQTIEFLNNLKVKYVKPDEWMSKSHDVAPMGYAIWGHLKQRLNKMKIETLEELKNDSYMNGRKWTKVTWTKF
ncbi:unnamed protein product [Rotaria socialis]|uniref:Uncharacterized protein n=1 Tax=Rotaria socialis TaxID=392032 RepID=A0A820WVC8_9BILA|nr:unnamed protein product [Rotaria socialis]